MTVTLSHSQSGPLPPPELLLRYDEIVPGLAKQIADGAREHREHAIRVGTRMAEADIRHGRMGLWLGAASLAGILGVVTFCAAIGQPWVAVAVAGMGTAGIITAFIRGPRT